MNITKNIDFRRVLAEGAIIVVSILLAFWIDAWWAALKERDEEKLLLSSLHRELEANRENLKSKIEFHEEIQAAIQTLLEQAALPVPELDDDEIDTLIGASSWFATPSTFEMSAFDAVVHGGSLAIIEDRSLRARITGWRQDVEAVVRVEVQDYDTFSEIWMPYLRRNAYMPQIHNTIAVQPGSGADDYLPDLPLGQHAGSHIELLQDREFQNILLHRLWVQADILYQYELIEPRLRELMGMLENEID